METKTKKSENTQGVEEPKTKERRYQLTEKMLKELVADDELLSAFMDTSEKNPEMKTPILFQFAKAIKKQLKLSV